MSKYKCTTCGAPTDNDQTFCELFEVHRCDECDKRFHQEIAWQSEGETLMVDKLTCPYCGYEYEDYDGYEFDEGTTEDVECPECSRRFDVEVEVQRVYSTKRSLCEMPENYGEEDEEE